MKIVLVITLILASPFIVGCSPGDNSNITPPTQNPTLTNTNNNIPQNIPKPDYTKFSNPLNGYTIEYFTDWEINKSPHENDIFTSADGVFIEVRYVRIDYKTLLSTFSVNKELSPEVINAIDGSIPYSIFTTKIGTTFKRTYLSGVNADALIIDCTYGTTNNPSTVIEIFLLNKMDY